MAPTNEEMELNGRQLPYNDKNELKTTYVSHRSRPSHKHRLEVAVALKLIPDIRNVSELVEFLADEGLDRYEKLSRDHAH